MLVNENLDIVQYRGRTSNYLEPPPGEPTTNLLKMAREGLFFELRNAIEEVRKHHRAVRREGLRVRVNSNSGDSLSFNLEVVPVRPPASRETCFLVLFDEAPAPETAAAATNGGASEPHSQADEEREVPLRRELTAIKEYLQSLLTADAANEELRSANEGSLRATKSCKAPTKNWKPPEELQSTNEELTTVNEQLHTRNLELTQVNNDLTNLLGSMAMPLVMVGSDLRIRRYTEAACRTINLRDNDIGRPLSDLKTNIDIPDLDDLIREVIEKVELREREVLDHEGRWHRLRIHPYRTADGKIEGGHSRSTSTICKKQRRGDPRKRGAFPRSRR